MLSISGYAFTIPFQRAFEIPGVGSPASLAAAITMVPVAAAVLTGPIRNRFPRFLVMQAALTVIVVLSLGVTRLPTQTAHPYLRSLGPNVALQAIQLLIISWIICEFIDSRRAFLIAASGYVLGGYVAVYLALRTIGTDRVPAPNRYTGSVAAQPNVQALVLVIGLPLAWFVFNQARHPHMRLVALGYAPACLVGVLLTASRSGLAALAISSLCIALSLRAAPVPLRAAVIVLVLCGAPLVPRFLPDDAVTRSVSSVEDEQTTTQDLGTRQALWRIGLQVASESPWLGSGQGAVRERVADATAFNTEVSSHNSIVNVAAEYGFPAAGLFIAVYVASLRSAIGARWILRSVGLGLALATFAVLQVVNLEWEKANWLALGLVTCAARLGGSLNEQGASRPTTTVGHRALLVQGERHE